MSNVLYFQPSYENSFGDQDFSSTMSLSRFAPTLAHTTIPMQDHSSTSALIGPVIAHCDGPVTTPPCIAQARELAGGIPLGGNAFNPAQLSGIQAVPEYNHYAQPLQDIVVEVIMARLRQIPLENQASVLDQCIARVRQDVVRASARPNEDHDSSVSPLGTSDRSLQQFRCMDGEVPLLPKPGVVHRAAACWSPVWTGTSSAGTPSNEISDVFSPRTPSNGSQVPSVPMNQVDYQHSRHSHARHGSHDACHPVETPAQHHPLDSSVYLTYTNPPNSAREISAAHVRHGQLSTPASDFSGVYIPRMARPVTGTLPSFTPHRRGRRRRPDSEFPKPKMTCPRANCEKNMLSESIRRHIREVHEGKKREHPQRQVS
ncbi:hypothetical protein PAXRUDRAFT_35759 [Paxillus rubicundulus Ve08.2h10]|uniref:Uncharacterized protein n=1 Tax=Paxillus rubicundulus Ve08.2h10 TaxID=930991 RepID=A0A0D0DJN9_9AGAM|nr:hypothetical protein PAXRUDRAFT_35759 [Paxillus rubicundulus Ve08.2h10]